MAASSAASRNPDTYFRRVGPLTLVLVLGAMIFFGWAAFASSTVPYDILGPLGRFTKYLVENHRTALRVGYIIGLLLHLGEASYAVVLCKKKGINNGLTQFLWFVQTFLVGIFSLRLLLAYKPQGRRQ